MDGGGLIPQAAKQTKARTYTLSVRAEECQRHQAARLQSREVRQAFHKRHQLVGMQPVFALLPGSVHLHEHIKIAFLRVEAAVQYLCQSHAVQCMKLRCEADEVFHLVGLEVADDTPADGEI